MSLNADECGRNNKLAQGGFAGDVLGQKTSIKCFEKPECRLKIGKELKAH